MAEKMTPKEVGMRCLRRAAFYQREAGRVTKRDTKRMYYDMAREWRSLYVACLMVADGKGWYTIRMHTGITREDQDWLQSMFP